jgi:hypothetical protein
MRFVCKTVPKLWDELPPEGVLSPRERHLAMTRQTAERLIACKRSMRGLQLKLNHRPGVSPGRVLGAYIYNDALYHVAELDETTLAGAEMAKSVRDGSHRQVSLTHFQRPDGRGAPVNLELSLCTGNGARTGSGIIEIRDDIPEGVVMASAEFSGEDDDNKERDEFEREREYYLGCLVAASEDAASLSVPSYNQPELLTSIVLSSSAMEQTNPPPPSPPVAAQQPAAPAPAVVEKRQSELLEERLARFKNDGVVPDDARPNESYFVYLMRNFSENGSMVSSAMRDRVMEELANKTEAQSSLAKQLAEQKAQYEGEISDYTRSIVEPLVRKFGSRAPVPVSLDELKEASSRLDKPRLMNMASNMMAVQASDEMAQHQQMMADRERMVRQEQEAMAARKAVLEQELNRDRRMDYLNRIQLAEPPAPAPRARQQQLPPVTPSMLAQDKVEHRAGAFEAAASATDPVAQAQQRRLKMKQAQSYLVEQLRLFPNETRIAGMSDEQWERVLRQVEGNEEVPVKSTVEYLKSRGIDTRQPGVEQDQYVSGMVAASDEFMDAHYPADKAARLKSQFNANMDRAGMAAYHSAVRDGRKDPMDISALLRSGETVLLPRRSTNRGHAAYDRRWNPVDAHLYGRGVDGWVNARSSVIRGQALSLDSDSPFFRGADYMM